MRTPAEISAAIAATQREAASLAGDQRQQCLGAVAALRWVLGSQGEIPISEEELDDASIRFQLVIEEM